MDVVSNAEGIGGPLRCDEISASAWRTASRPHGECAGRVGYAQLSDSGDQLRARSRRSCPAGSVFVLVIEAYRADRDNQKRATSVNKARSGPA